MAPRRIPRNHQNETHDEALWNKLYRFSAYRPTTFATSNRERLNRRRVKREEERISFKNKYRFKIKRGAISKDADIVKCLQHWVKYLSWSYCDVCGLLHRNSLHPRCFNSKGAKAVSSCKCTNKYVVPSFSAIPSVLCCLSKSEESILRVYDIDIGPKKVAPAGHRIKNGAFELRYRDDTVEERIEAVNDMVSKTRLQKAYEYLLQSSYSTYKQYVENQISPGPKKIKFWQVYRNFPGVECALWPVLYPFTSWCESILDGSSSRDSTLASFRQKLMSPIVDYNNNFALLQLQYDRWIYRTVTGAVAVGKKMKVSPRRALETKAFSTEYWRWQHRFLQDAVFQYGKPSFFITISPYEWDFPKPQWVERAILEHDLIPTACGAMETLHIAHTLEQICKGYLTGCNSSEWETHSDKYIFHDQKLKKPGNVSCTFFRFEYQNRRTIHLHMLVWLRNVSHINMNALSATIPEYDEELAFLVHRIQPSDKPAKFLIVSEEPNHISANKVVLQHSEVDSNLNLRAYIPTVISLLNSRIDVQVADGNSALTQYVSTYVTKLSDTSEVLSSTESTPFQAALPFLIDSYPGEPEMSMAFSGISMSYTNLSRDKLVPPVSEQYFDKSVIFKKYLSRPACDEALTCVQYCRLYHVSKKVPSLSVKQNLVGVKYKYIFLPQFFFQYTIVNTSFRNLEDLRDENYDILNDDLKPFSYMMKNHHDFLLNSEDVTEFLSILNYNSIKIKEFLMFKDGLSFLYYKTLNHHTDKQTNDTVTNIELTTIQSVIFNHVVDKMKERCSLNCSLTDDDSLSSISDSSDTDVCFDGLLFSTESSDSTPSSSSSPSIQSERDIHVKPNFNLDDTDVSETFIKPVLISGKPGTGKTFLLQKIVNHCVENSLKVLFACPTAHQARTILSLFNDETSYIIADTIHSLFKIPIDSCETLDINWSLLRYDLIVIDEVAMVTFSNMLHVLKTIRALPSKPLLLLSGDKQQQQPLTTENNRTTTGVSIFTNGQFLSLCDRFSLYTELRSNCNILLKMLKDIRIYYPTDEHLNYLNSVAYTDKGKVTATVIQQAFSECPASTFLTITRKGSAMINDSIISFLFSKERPLAGNIRTADGSIINIYNGMRVIFTKNMCKHLSIVNGQCGVVTDYRKGNVYIRLSNDKLVFLHCTRDDDHEDEYYPFLPNYAMTIFKVQGKTIPKIILWLDNNVSSPGAGDVALSRVTCHTGIRLLEKVDRCQVCPIKVVTEFTE